MQIEIIIACLLSYVLCGASQVGIDLSQDVINKPGWALRPTWFGAFMIGLTWPLRPIMRGVVRKNNRAVVFGILEVLFQFAIVTFFYWANIVILKYFINSMVLVIIITIVLTPLSSRLFFPVASLIMIPLTFLLTWPLDIIFPLKKES